MPKRSGPRQTMVTIMRDPFARAELVRKCISSTCSCDFCGNVSAWDRMYIYGTHHDAGRLSWDNHVFCNVGCYRAYHGLADRTF
jgi:hypothetical protein